MMREKMYMVLGFVLFGISGAQAWFLTGGLIHWLGGIQFVGSVVCLTLYWVRNWTVQQMMPVLWALWGVGLLAWVLDFSRVSPAFVFALLLWGLALQDEQRKSRADRKVKHQEISRS
ncbi:hypothetical protein [Deinococcus misasensis]|uniref:hypothetical protein n=1 Tax=Deinococcus misasensis TaxID=392413 RepID=UPI000AE556D3|nr:hypothetical protein [Deinococcus misasensis]